MKQYTKPTIKEMPVSLQLLLCGSPLDVNNEKVSDYTGEDEKPKTWGTIW